MGATNSLESSGEKFDPRLVIGPTQVCGLLSAVLFGCLACQSYVYFTRFKSDHFVLKVIVSAVTLLQLGHFVCIISTLWTMTVNSYCDPSQLMALHVAVDLAISFSGFTAFIVQASNFWLVTATSTTDLVTFGDLQFLLIAILFIVFDSCMAMAYKVFALMIHQFNGHCIGNMVVGNFLLASLNRRLLLRESWGAPRGSARSCGGINTIVFKAGAMQSQADPLENSRNLDVEMFQAEGPADEEYGQV
ncbi:uncharacterized protein F5891DRAFT_980128 [Suillus fuscotomentosus]|uniref:Uncharacterized protein n=1 Tax=Suillus fuscotomentosus TaxID=1912939 RepID=A0AAD4E6K7_9AGAM|nr:uncharacterized protein F5891DRAFT_980128 [Suillus fuscotomentosus]KAG1900532.1 hypothetical protein F5891DRAFT_980128 [Suillus fuscotomentosus]